MAYTVLSSILGALDMVASRGYPLAFSRTRHMEPVFNNAIAVAGTGASTLTAAQLIGGIIEGPLTGSATYTLDTAANIDAVIANPSVGDTFQVQLINTAGGAFTITIAAGSGVTLKGTATVAQSKCAFLSFFRTGTAAWTCYSTVSA
jgi:hypothetical protein